MLVNCPALTTVTIAAGNPNLKVDTNTNKAIVNVAGTAIRNVYLPRTEGVSTTEIRQEIKDH